MCVQFEVAFRFLYAAMMMVTNNANPAKSGQILLLAPSDFWEGAAPRRRLFRIFDMRVVREWRLGRWSFYTVRRVAK